MDNTEELAVILGVMRNRIFSFANVLMKIKKHIRICLKYIKTPYSRIL